MSALDRERLSAYLDGELPEPERAAVERELKTSEEARRLLAELAALHELARSTEVEAPEGYFESLPGRVRARLEATGGRRRRARVPAWTWAAAAALAVAVLVPFLSLERGLEPPPPAAAAVPARDAPVPHAPAASAVPPPPSRGAGPSVAENATEAVSAERRLAEPKAAAATPRPAATAAPPTPSLGEAVATPAPRPAGRAASGPAGFAAPAADGAPEPAEEAAPPAQDTEADSAVAPPPAAASAPPPPPAPPAGFAEGLASTSDRADATPAGERARIRAQGPSTAKRRSAEAVGADAERFPSLAARRPETAAEARLLREDWRGFVMLYPGSPLADEGRVRTVEAGLEAYRLGGEEPDRGIARRDAEAYLAREDAVQPERVRALLAALER